MKKINETIEINKYIIELMKNSNNSENFKNRSVTRNEYEEILKILYNIKNVNTFGDELFKRKDLPMLIHKLVVKEKLYDKFILSINTQNQTNIYTSSIEHEISDESIFNLSGISTIFTIILLYYLSECNKLNFDDNIIKYCSQYKNLKEITIRDVMKYHKNIKINTEINDIHSYLHVKDIIHNATIDSARAYSCYSAIILRDVIESAANEKYNNLVYEIILKPNFMKNTSFDNISNNKNDGFDLINEIYKRKFNNAPGHDGYFSCEKDMRSLSNSLINNKIISKSSLLDICKGYNGVGTLSFNNENGNISKYISSSAFMLRGKNGSFFVIDPLNKFSIFIGGKNGKIDRNEIINSAINEALIYNFIDHVNINDKNTLRKIRC